LRNKKDFETGLLPGQDLRFRADKTYILLAYLAYAFISKTMQKSIRCSFEVRLLLMLQKRVSYTVFEISYTIFEIKFTSQHHYVGCSKLTH